MYAPKRTQLTKRTVIENVVTNNVQQKHLVVIVKLGMFWMRTINVSKNQTAHAKWILKFIR